MMRFVCFMLMSSAAFAAPLPALQGTDVYTNHKDCVPVDLSHWQHPTKHVLISSKVELLALEMCANYPIFHVNAIYTPMLHTTDSFYLPFYAKMWVANGKNPMAIDIKNWRDMVELKHYGKGLTTEDELYSP